MRFEWQCPRCKAPANGCGTKPTEICDGPLADGSGCMGFICECEHETGEDHGSTLEDPCKNANCHHCEWGGTFPKPTQGTTGLGEEGARGRVDDARVTNEGIKIMTFGPEVSQQEVLQRHFPAAQYVDQEYLRSCRIYWIAMGHKGVPDPDCWCNFHDSSIKCKLHTKKEPNL